MLLLKNNLYWDRCTQVCHFEWRFQHSYIADQSIDVYLCRLNATCCFHRKGCYNRWARYLCWNFAAVSCSKKTAFAINWVILFVNFWGCKNYVDLFHDKPMNASKPIGLAHKPSSIKISISQVESSKCKVDFKEATSRKTKKSLVSATEKVPFFKLSTSLAQRGLCLKGVFNFGLYSYDCSRVQSSEFDFVT